MEFENEKKNEYMYFFGYFQWLEQIINIDEKKKIWCSNVGWATAQTILWELYCKAVIVLQ